ncbi:MAG: hypothetical protein ACE5KD_03815 [Candidatus Bathyarchaeia archaeon]
MTLQQSISRKTDRYEEMLNEAVDKALTRVFGSTAAKVIYTYLENNHSIKKNEIAEKIESFSQAMQEYFNSGATVVEKEILESFYSDLGVFQPVELENNNEFVQRLKTLMPP